MLDIIRYLWRRKVRTALTMVTVTVEIFAVTAVGGFAEQLECTIQVVEQDALSRITVQHKDYELPLGESTVRTLRRMDGVAGVTITMVIAVNEQTRQIGLKKAVGAENGDILAEVLMDASKLGTLGGLVGVLMAWGATLILNPLIKVQVGIDILDVSPRLALGAVIFSMILGMVTGVFPARRAALLDPVVALHTE